MMRAIFPAIALCLMASAASASPEPTDAQLRARLNAAAQQEQALEQRLADDNAKLGAKSVRVSALFGESDEEKAARLQHEQNQDQGIATLNQRVGDIENSLRSLTGQVEQLDHRISVLNDRMERMQKDFDYKLCTMAAQQLGADQDNALPCGGAQTSAPPPSQYGNPAPQSFSQSGGNATGAPQHLAPPPGVLGTIPSNTALPLPAPSTAQGDMPQPAPPVVPHPEFDRAMNLLAKAQYDQAAAAFRAYADKNVTDPLAGAALYWVGDIQYVQKDYASAVRSFAESIKKYPTSPRAPDSMLKLGESLIAMNEKKEGCTALAAIPSKYPTASKSVAAKAASEHKALCGK